MKRPFLESAAFVLAVGCFTGAASAQGFQAVYSKDGTDVWAVGDAGLAHRSFDGGASWTAQNIGAKPLHGVAQQGLTVVLISDDGEVRRSTNNGGTFALQTLPGAPHLRAIEMADASNGWIVGDGGNIFVTADGGATWSPQTSGTAQRLNSVRFRSTTEGWAVGAAGTVLYTTNGGLNWSPVVTGATANLRSVDYAGTAVWVVGDDGIAVKSPDGAVWTAVNLKLDAKSDVTGVWMESANNLVLTGGGGFLRKTTDGGTTWTFQKNPVLAETSDLFYLNGGTKGWATHTKTKAVVRTTDSGATWTYSGSGTRSWVSKLTVPGGSVRGNTLHMSHVNKNTYYVALSTRVYRSTDRGETWAQISTITGSGSKANAFYVHPQDDNKMVVAIGAPDRIMRTTDGGANWTQTLAVDFTEYGVPLEMNQDVPNDLYFGPEDGKLYISHDFGATWSTLSTPGFRSPCDIQVVQDNNNIIWVGDGVTGVGSSDMFRSTDGGLTFTKLYSGPSSEIPMISSPHLNPSLGLATHWSGGGVDRTTNLGANWAQVSSVGSAWGCDFAKDDPNVVTFGVYSGGVNYISLDAGATGTYQSTSLGGTNYAYYAVDRATMLAMQASAIYKMTNTYTVTPNNTQALTVAAPNGGEVWTAGESRNIAWTGTNLGLVKIEYRPDGATAWQQVTLVEGYLGTYNWTVPSNNTVTAEIRISDAWDAAPIDGSNSTFTIHAPVVAAAAPSLDFGQHAVGTLNTSQVTVQNTGTATFNGTVGVTGDGFTLLSSPVLSLAASTSANLDVQFAPVAAQVYAGGFSVTGNAPAVNVTLGGEGTQAAALQIDVPNGGEAWQYASSQNIQWSSVIVGQVRIEYQTTTAGPWTLIADDVPATPNTYAWTIPNTPSNTARVRVSQVGGGLVDASDNDFTLGVPFFSASTSEIDFGLINAGSTATQTLTVSNPGNAPLTISSVTDDSSVFDATPTSIVIAPLANTNFDVHYSPAAPGTDSGTMTFVDDAPGSPHVIIMNGQAEVPSDAGDFPTTYALDQNGPNPFQGQTLIRYRLPQTSQVSLEVFDLQGRRVATLVESEQGRGSYAIPFGSGLATAAGSRIGNLANGVYFVRLQAGTFSKTAKLVLAR